MTNPPIDFDRASRKLKQAAERVRYLNTTLNRVRAKDAKRPIAELRKIATAIYAVETAYGNRCCRDRGSMLATKLFDMPRFYVEHRPEPGAEKQKLDEHIQESLWCDALGLDAALHQLDTLTKAGSPANVRSALHLFKIVAGVQL